MLAPTRDRVLPTLPPIARLAVLGVFFGILFYAFAANSPTKAPPELLPVLETKVVVPTLDAAILAKAQDDSREHRLILEPAPLRHLLETALNVGPTVAAALGLPAEPVPVAELRAAPDAHRGRWLWYKGELVDLAGPREGHPVAGYGIYEATVRLPDGNHVLTAFSIAPTAEVKRGAVVRVEGFLLKVRDTTYPQSLDGAPMLVGRQIQRDYLDWPPVTSLDPEALTGIDESCYPGTRAWYTIDEDQSTALWHLAAFARDTRQARTFAEWRKIGTLNANETYPLLQQNRLERGAPLRLLGTLVKLDTIAADPNPAGIKFWTVAWVQVRDFGGHLIPVWIPKRVEHVAQWSSLEVRAHYYRWFVYTGREDDRYRVPLFVAADLDTFALNAGRTMGDIGTAIAAVVTALLLLIFWGQRRAARQALAHARDLDARRRRRRERAVATPQPPAG